MATIKSPYTVNQYVEVLRKFAYDIALKAVQNIPKMPKADNQHWWGNTVLIKSEGPELKEVDTPDVTIMFEGTKTHVYADKKSEKDSVRFSLEEKIYQVSGDNTKISFYRSRDDKAGIERDSAKIRAFLDKLMVGIEPERRFSLKRKVTTGHAIQVPA